MIYKAEFDKARDIRPVSVLPLEAYDTAYQYKTGNIPVETVTSNKTFNGATLGQIKGKITDPFLAMEVSRLPNLVGSSSSADGSEDSENENAQK